eukprot:TRINITY_DN32830_c0_g1_i1.p1 TRINITY_DN32830_c0_g1~~TRINITY_DN32830_c0_g1_i1.p1  ORF type:complete len:1209 (-),score=341.23 TRINITY_DN32830_c0_g1_i1:211-3837(-)
MATVTEVKLNGYAATAPKLAYTGSDEQIRVGHRVLVGSTQSRGVIRFVGPTEFSAGEWIGVALEEANGKNDGCVKDVRYFSCEPCHGIFVRAAALTRDVENKARDEPQCQPLDDACAGPAVVSIGSMPMEMAEDRRKRTSLDDWETTDWTKLQQNGTNGLQPKQGAGVNRPPLSGAETKANEKAEYDEASRIMQSRLRNGGLSVDAAAAKMEDAQRELAEAMEEHDVDRLRRALPAAASCGVARMELDAALRVLNFEVQRSLIRDVEDVRAAVTQLCTSVELAEARVTVAEKAAADGGSATAPAATPACFPTSAAAKGGVPSAEWLDAVGAELEERVWSGLQKRVEATVKEAVSQATQALIAAITEIQEVCADSQSPRRRPCGARAMATCHEVEEYRTTTEVRQEAVKWNKDVQDIFEEYQFEGSIVQCHKFCAAMVKAAPSVTPAQARVLWEGYLRQTESRTLEWQGFKTLVEAVVDDHLAAEFADMHVDHYRLLGRQNADSAATRIQARARGRAARRKAANQSTAEKPEQERRRPSVISPSEKVAREDAAKSMQREFRRALAWRQAGKFTFARAVEFARRRNMVWANVFDQVGGGKDLGCSEFARGLTRLLPRIRTVQAEVLWEGFVKATGLAGVDLRGFFEMVEAGLQSDSRLAEFADLSEEQFQDILLEIHSQDEDVDGTSAAGERSGGAGADAADIDGLQMQLGQEGWRRRRSDLAILADQVAGSPSSAAPSDFTWPQFQQAFLKAHPRINAGQASAIWHGLARGQKTVDFEAFCLASEAAEAGDREAAEVADMSLEAYQTLSKVGADDAAVRIQAIARGRQGRACAKRKVNAKGQVIRIECKPGALSQDEAAMRIQGLHRMRAARVRCDEKRGLDVKYTHSTAAMRKKHEAYVDAFEKALKQQGGASTELKIQGFCLALAGVHQRLSMGQVKALWEGVTEGLGKPGVEPAVTVKSFCAICEAAAKSDQAAADFADMHVGDFVKLGGSNKDEFVSPEAAAEEVAEAAFEAAAADAVDYRTERPDFAKIFDDVRGAAPKLTLEQLWKAVVKVQPKFTTGQVNAMAKMLGGDTFELADFGSLAELAELGAREAAEFADISLEAFEALGREGADDAATKIQARLRGRMSRASLLQTSELPQAPGDLQAVGDAVASASQEDITKFLVSNLSSEDRRRIQKLLDSQQAPLQKENVTQGPGIALAPAFL